MLETAKNTALCLTVCRTVIIIRFCRVALFDIFVLLPTFWYFCSRKITFHRYPYDFALSWAYRPFLPLCRLVFRLFVRRQYAWDVFGGQTDAKKIVWDQSARSGYMWQTVLVRQSNAELRGFHVGDILLCNTPLATSFTAIRAFYHLLMMLMRWMQILMIICRFRSRRNHVWSFPL